MDGVGDYTINLAREFARHGHNVTVVCRDYENVCTNYEDIDIYPVVEQWNRRAISTILYLIELKQIDIVFLQYVPHGFHPKGLPFGLIQVMRRIKEEEIQVFTFFHEICVPMDKLTLKRILLRYIMYYLTRRVLLYSDYIATSIDWYSKKIENICGCKKVPVIPIPSNVPMHFLSETEKIQLHQLIAPNDEFIIGLFGKRNLDTCLEAVNELVKSGRKIKLLSIGKTSLLDKSIDSNIIYQTGILDINNLSRYLYVADCIVLPEPSSGCSFKSGSLMAALRAGKVVITSKGFMTDASLVNQFNIIFADSAKDYERELLGIMEDRNKSVSIGMQAKLLVQDVDWLGTYRQYLKILQ